MSLLHISWSLNGERTPPVKTPPNLRGFRYPNLYTTRSKPPPFASTYRDYPRRLQVLLAGRAAGELLLSAASHGAGGRRGSDLQVAASMAAGMCASLGIAGKSKLLYLCELDRTNELLSYPEVRAAALHELAKAEKAVRALLSERKAPLRAIAARLLRDKCLDGLTAAAMLRTAAARNRGRKA